MTKNKKFYGSDFTEIIDYFKQSKKYPYKMEYSNDPDWIKREEFCNNHFLKWLSEQCFCNERAKKDIARVCRRYTDALIISSELNHYSQPLWIGLSRIRHDETFLKYFSVLFEYLWT